MSQDDFWGVGPDVEYSKEIFEEYNKKVDKLINTIAENFKQADDGQNEQFFDLLSFAFGLKIIFYSETEAAEKYISNFDTFLTNSEELFNSQFKNIENLFNQIKSIYSSITGIRNETGEILLIKDPSFINDFFKQFNSAFGTSFKALPVEIQKLYDNLASLQPTGSKHNLTMIITFVEVVGFVLQHNPRQDDLENLFHDIQNLLTKIIRRNITIRCCEN